MRLYIKILSILIALAFTACKETPDLENTYFPADTGYRWVYEVWQHMDVDGAIAEQVTDTVTTKVDSVSEAMGVKFIYLENGHIDVSGEMSIIEDEISVYHGEKQVWVPLQPARDFIRTDSARGENYYAVYMNNDTLVFTSARDLKVVSDVSVTKRVKGVGVVQQSWGGSALMVGGKVVYRLLYFIKGEDTVWRYEDCP